MLFRTNVCVVLAVRQQPKWRPNCDNQSHDTASYTFGINADEPAAAAAVAVRAAENAVDRDGAFVGGVVVEVQSRCVGSEEFDGYEKYLMQPLEEPGIFYVSGITFRSIAAYEANGAAASIRSMREWIAENGLPPPSFVHPPLEPDAPKTVRLVCPVCERWIEIDSSGLLYSFFDGLDRLSSEFEEARQAAETARPFVESHFVCLRDREDVNALLFLYEDDERYQLLDESKRV